MGDKEYIKSQIKYWKELLGKAEGEWAEYVHGRIDSLEDLLEYYDWQTQMRKDYCGSDMGGQNE